MNIKLLVGEPWNFKGPDGANTIYVRYKQEGIGKYGDWIICTCKPINVDTVTIKSLLLSNRHGKELTAYLKEGKIVQINAYWRKDGEDWDKQAVDNAQMDSSIIGGFLIVSGQIM